MSKVERAEVLPMKVNAFEMAQRASTQLLPLFPYAHRGAIVPCSVAFESSGAGVDMGYFVHTNSVDEISVTLASDGPQRTGEVRVGPRAHGVGGRGTAGAFFRIGVVTQRQLEDGEQPELIAFQCERCSAELFCSRVDMADAADAAPLSPLPSNVLGAQAAAAFNASEAIRLCKACGHENRPFPSAIWGWDRYVRNSRIAQKARGAIEELERAEGPPDLRRGSA